MVDGRLVWEDSPLVRALEHGRVLVLDEADKCPLEVCTPSPKPRISLQTEIRFDCPAPSGLLGSLPP